VSEEPAAQSQAVTAGDLDGRNTGEAKAAFDAFIESYQLKYDKAADCLDKDRDALLAFYDFPAAHVEPHRECLRYCASPRAPIEGRLSNATALAMVFKLVEAAQKSWRRLDGHNQLPKVVLGAKFKDGLEVVQSADRQPKAAA